MGLLKIDIKNLRMSIYTVHSLDKVRGSLINEKLKNHPNTKPVSKSKPLSKKDYRRKQEQISRIINSNEEVFILSKADYEKARSLLEKEGFTTKGNKIMIENKLIQQLIDDQDFIDKLSEELLCSPRILLNALESLLQTNNTVEGERLFGDTAEILRKHILKLDKRRK